jgi:defect-in-organelle-trafficking protein DotC
MAPLPDSRALRRLFFSLALCLVLLPAAIIPADAQTTSHNRQVPDRAPVATPPATPPKLDALENRDEDDDSSDTSDIGALGKPGKGLQLRQEALKEAALSYGARGGLARHTWEISQQLKIHDSALSRTFDFSKLLIPVGAGLLMEPPIVSEADDAAVVADRGQNAAVADRVYRINQNARIVTRPRDWHTYLERDWGDVTPPPDTLLPQDDDERGMWKRWVDEGWKAGWQQADDIFQADLDRLTHDFTGMVRYRTLLAQGIITAPYANNEDRGITGGGNEMRVGDRAITITGLSQLNPQGTRWTPADH